MSKTKKKNDIVSLKKLSIKNICNLDNRELNTLAKENKEICSVGGRVTGFGLKDTAYGQAIKLTGYFVGKNLVRDTEKTYESEVCYLPAYYVEQIRDQLDRMEPDDALTFNVIISLNAHPSSGYEYIVKSVISEEVKNERQGIMNLVCESTENLLEDKSGQST